MPPPLMMASSDRMFMNLNVTIHGKPEVLNFSTAFAELLSTVPPRSRNSFSVPQMLKCSPIDTISTGGGTSSGISASAAYPRYQAPSTTDLKLVPRRTNWFVPCRRCPWSDHVTIDCKRKICPCCRATNVDSRHIAKCAREERALQSNILDSLRRLEEYAERLTRKNADVDIKDEEKVSL